jgi:membrane-associated phospholipid phosphatase
MGGYLTVLDARVLLDLNHALAAHPHLYKAALFATDKGGDLVLAATAGLLWLWPHRLPGGRDRDLGAAWPSAARRASRARLIAFGAGMMAAYVLTRLVAFALDKPRPFASFLPVEGIAGAFSDLRAFGSFPSDHAALLGALPVGFARWSQPLAWAWTVLAVLLMAVRVAVGFHYPFDMIAGALIGAGAASLAMAVFEAWSRLRVGAMRVATGFARPREAYLLYPLLAIGGLEFAAHFKHVLGMLLWVRAQLG